MTGVPAGGTAEQQRLGAWVSGDEVTWGIDLADGGAALAIAILLTHDQAVHYNSGRAIHRASESYRGEGKTDAKDAAVIADQVRVRRDLHPIRTGDETVIDLRILTGRRMDLMADQTRTVNRLRAQLTGILPGLERVLDLTNTGPLTLLTDYQTPTTIRELGARRLTTWLRNRHVVRADQLAEAAVQAAERQHTSLPGEKLTAQLVHTLAKEVMALNQQVAELDKAIEARFRDHHTFEVITSMPGLGVILGAEFLAATGGDMTVFGTADRSPAAPSPPTGPARCRGQRTVGPGQPVMPVRACCMVKAPVNRARPMIAPLTPWGARAATACCSWRLAMPPAAWISAVRRFVSGPRPPGRPVRPIAQHREVAGRLAAVRRRYCGIHRDLSRRVPAGPLPQRRQGDFEPGLQSRASAGSADWRDPACLTMPRPSDESIKRLRDTVPFTPDAPSQQTTGPWMRVSSSGFGRSV